MVRETLGIVLIVDLWYRVGSESLHLRELLQPKVPGFHMVTDGISGCGSV